jgi:hypothetical protein
VPNSVIKLTYHAITILNTYQSSPIGLLVASLAFCILWHFLLHNRVGTCFRGSVYLSRQIGFAGTKVAPSMGSLQVCAESLWGRFSWIMMAHVS